MADAGSKGKAAMTPMNFRTVLVAVFALTLCRGGETASLLDGILDKMESADEQRRAALTGYSSVRRYRIENGRFHVNAAMTVEVVCDAAGHKRFRVLEVSGPAALRKLVFQRMLDTEAKSSASGEAQAGARISRTNYLFKLADEVEVEGRRQYVLEATPKAASPVLFRGRVWVDAETLAIVKIEGEPARNPSFWVRKTHFVHEYKRVGPQWLASANRSESEIRVFGRSAVTIEYGEYRLDERTTGSVP
jgi:hypothetical protein